VGGRDRGGRKGERGGKGEREWESGIRRRKGEFDVTYSYDWLNISFFSFFDFTLTVHSRMERSCS
jgi:hypothetical protein